MTRVPELTPLLKRLKLSTMLDTMPELIALARRAQLNYASILSQLRTKLAHKPTFSTVQVLVIHSSIALAISHVMW